MSEQIQWGIIGCGDVTELKSGPAFNKVPGSRLIAVMRRDAAKAQDYAQRHHVPKYYSNAQELINDPDINAIYIATPPDSHEAYAMAAMAAGKPVYVEKPMALSFSAALKMKSFAEENNVKLTIAHYRNAQPFFKKIKELLEADTIGKIHTAELVFNRVAMSAEELAQPGKAWRVDPAVSGGGLFHDMAPHQLGLMLFYFAEMKNASGKASNTNHLYKADDRVEGTIVFNNRTTFYGSWNFNASENADECIITGSEGIIRFPVFGEHELTIEKNDTIEKLVVDMPYHVQQPMIEQTVRYFLGTANNPCSAAEGCEVMRLMEIFTSTA